ncbi:hypothetical protein [Fuerstiella marisgermanici]|uniref:Uncharacterized protein n=1 Tax=Fuerstiella marisgermanici TaxID=1891926 RepID=A0A1P8WS06_9PLAN|nr:hypothetical protein [Fuerstiella marisgermanici]APZ96846.1 hypothetical protein Fuma_06520 [Fuerstiella marisgermanici]
MSNTFSTSKINTLAACNEFQYLLLGDLRDILEETPDESNKRWLLEVLNVLVDLMPRERRLNEDSGGYMAEVLDEFPNWNRQVMRLHLKKLHLDYALRELRNRIRDEESWVAVADQLSSELADWMSLFHELHRAEASLVMDAMLLDIGPGD